MKRLLGLIVVIGLAGAGLSVAEAGGARKPKPRLVHAEYTGPYKGISTPGLSGGHDDCTPDTPQPGCILVPLRPGDRFVQMDIYDLVGGAGLVAADVTVEDEDGHWDFVGRACGSTRLPLAIPPGYDLLQIELHEGTCYGSTTPSIVTKGTVDVFLSRKSWLR